MYDCITPEPLLSSQARSAVLLCPGYDVKPCKSQCKNFGTSIDRARDRQDRWVASYFSPSSLAPSPSLTCFGTSMGMAWLHALRPKAEVRAIKDFPNFFGRHVFLRGLRWWGRNSSRIIRS